MLYSWRLAARLASRPLLFASLIVATFSLISSNPAHAETWPTRQLTMVIPFPPGGVTDLIGRAVANKLSAELGQNVVVENKAGASGSVGSEVVARAAPDGYTLLLGNISTLGVNSATFAKTVMESGVEGYDVSSWQALVVPAATPQSVIDRLHSATAKLLVTPEIRDFFAGKGAQASPTTPQELGRHIASEVERWKAVGSKAGIKPNQDSRRARRPCSR